MPHPSVAYFNAWAAELGASDYQNYHTVVLRNAVVSHAARLDEKYAEEGLLEGGVVVQRAIVSAALTAGHAYHELLDEARKWLVLHTARFWGAALSECILGVEEAPPIQRPGLTCDLANLRAGRTLPIMALQSLGAQLAAAMNAHVRCMVLQTLHSADPRDAKKLALNLNGFVAKMPDANGIPQQVVRELPARGALLMSPKDLWNPSSKTLMVDPVLCNDSSTRCRFAMVADGGGDGGSAGGVQVCADDVACRNQLFINYPEQQQVFNAMRAALCCDVDFAFGCGKFAEARSKAFYAEQMLQHAGERGKAAAMASKRAFIAKKLVPTGTLKKRRKGQEGGKGCCMIQ